MRKRSNQERAFWFINNNFCIATGLKPLAMTIALNVHKLSAFKRSFNNTGDYYDKISGVRVELLATYATDPANSRGRLYQELSTPYRNEFERDRDRIIHSNAFKRLQYKTQVFVNHEGDLYRNRLTHSVEVSSVARSVAKDLNLSEDLAEAVALAHDLGHTPFGHAGEEALSECLKEYGGFSHNVHSLKLLTTLEQKYAAYDGLNLTWEVLEGIVKHNGPVVMAIPDYVQEYNAKHDLDLGNYSSAEAQVASLSDDITYVCHDLEDSVRANLINFQDIEDLPRITGYLHFLQAAYPEISPSRLIYEVVRKLIHYLIKDLLIQTKLNIQHHKIVHSDDIRHLGMTLVDFSDEVRAEVREIKAFLFDKVYRHNKIASMNLRCQKVIKGLFSVYCDNVDLLPFAWRKMIDADDGASKAMVIGDYIAGMTDRFAIKEYQDFYNLNFNKI